MALWFHATDVQAIHDALAAAGHTTVSAPVDGPCGRTFTFAEPDGHHITLHDRVQGVGWMPFLAEIAPFFSAAMLSCTGTVSSRSWTG
ncbi:hypothetical protein GCM10010231_18510 [Streptomyces sindenensis]|nr:hypothetical protein GCM10010231_18510 [Streptomyces sindenensis]